VCLVVNRVESPLFCGERDERTKSNRQVFLCKENSNTEEGGGGRGEGGDFSLWVAADLFLKGVRGLAGVSPVRHRSAAELNFHVVNRSRRHSEMSWKKSAS